MDQKYPNTELIIIDGGSIDKTISILKKYDSYISYWVSEPDNGQAHAINKGLTKATGTYFNWINSDDYLEPGSLNAIASHVYDNPNDDIICGYTRCFWNDDNETSHEYRMGIDSSTAATIYNVKMNQPGTFYKTKVVKHLGGVNVSLRYVFDDELWFKYLCEFGLNNIALIDKRLAQFRLHSSSKSVADGFSLFHQELLQVYLYILKSIEAPFWMIENLNNEIKKDSYVVDKAWQFDKLEKELLKAHFAKKFINSLFVKREYKSSNEALSMILENNLFEWSRLMLSLRFKLLWK